MRRNARALSARPGLTLFVAFLLTFMVGSVYASGVNVNPTSIRHTATTATGVRTAATLEATFTGTSGGVRNYSVPVPVSSGTLGNLAKAALKRGGAAAGWYSLAKGLIDGAGWAIDELQQQVVDGPSVPAEQVAPGTPMLCSKHGLGCSTSPTAFYALVNADLVRDGQGHLSVVSHTVDGLWVYFRLNNGGSYTYSWRTFSTWTPNYGTGHTPTPITDQQLGELLKQSPQVINAILIDPETGAPIHTPELTQAINDLRKSIEAANGLDPGPDVAPKDPEASQPMQSAWPTFCSWATVVCDFVDWVKTEPAEETPPEVPWEEELDPGDVTATWSAGLAGGSCPSPEQFTVSVGSYSSSLEFSYTPMCNLASMLRPLIIAIALCISAMIIGGFRSTKDA